MSESATLERAQTGDEQAFGELVAPHRRGLLAHCYRMCGSLQEAEDLVQEAMLRAWRGLGDFEGRSSFRGWIYRIATNATLDLLKRRRVRALPPARVPPSAADAVLAPPVTEPVWLEPFPDALLPDDGPAPDALLSQRESIGLAFLQALQQLPPNQRAAVLLKEVVGASASEIAALLDTSVPAVNSLLQRARETLAGASPPSAADERERQIVAAYVGAFEAANADALIVLLSDDARVSMPPVPTWFEGSAVIVAWLRQNVLSPAGAQRFVALPTRCNGQPAVAMFAGDGLSLVGVHVFDIVDGRIVEIVAFMDPATLRLTEPHLPTPS